jgi:hypothetical protein
MPFADNLELLKVGLAECYSRQSFRSKTTGTNFDCFFLRHSVSWGPTMSLRHIATNDRFCSLNPV